MPKNLIPVPELLTRLSNGIYLLPDGRECIVRDRVTAKEPKPAEAPSFLLPLSLTKTLEAHGFVGHAKAKGVYTFVASDKSAFIYITKAMVFVGADDTPLTAKELSETNVALPPAVTIELFKYIL